MNKEQHPLKPFLPKGAKYLILGSFPPPKARWCMEFFYPNWTNDFWRIWGYIAKGDKIYFAVPGEKRFNRERIERVCCDYGIALYDTAEQKSAETLQASIGCEALPVGGCVDTEYAGRKIKVWRMPSSSRAYPRPVEWKAEYYKKILE